MCCHGGLLDAVLLSRGEMWRVTSNQLFLSSVAEKF